jgi:hypothetical protein
LSTAPNLAEIIEQIQEVAARAPELVVTIALRESKKGRRRAVV